MNFDQELRSAVLRNLAAKSKIMAFVFIFILLIQVGFLIYTLFTIPDFFKRVPVFAPYAAFSLILAALCVEWYTHRFLKRSLERGTPIKNYVPYFVTLLEISFPSIVLSFAGGVIVSCGMPLSIQLLSSPPAIMYFIMIILSSLMLDKRLCILSGVLAGAEYLIISLIIVNKTPHTLMWPTSLAVQVFLYLPV
ncbi:MAG TPA: hypothetical protein VD905_18445 [Flavobacteriales bacterium]|nr:hypothetical protein [Flavobacteriales bacterium]